MLVVSDSSPLNVLIRLRLESVLPVLFDRVVIPPAVAEEMSHPNAPTTVREWLAAHPAWLKVEQPSAVDRTLRLDDGEREAISLAIELRADFLLVDDLKARKVAHRAGLAITGTLGILEKASERGLLKLRPALDQLRQTDFTIDPKLIDRALARDARRHHRDAKQT